MENKIIDRQEASRTVSDPGKKPLLSVIVPCYKVAEWLPRCLDSILAQTYENLEIICVDDGSPDRSGEILKEYAKRDGRIRVITQENKGLSGARNAGLDVAGGDYIGFVDSDDAVEPSFYETLYNLLLRYNADIADCAAVLDTDTGKEDQSGISLYRGPEIMAAAILDKIATPVWSKLYKAAIWKELRFPEGMYYEDSLTLPDICRMNPLLVRTEQKLYCYNRASSSIMRGKKTDRHLRSRLAVFDATLAYLKEQPGYEDLVAFFACSNVPSRSALVLKTDPVTEDLRKAYKEKLRGLFLSGWPRAKGTKYYREAPLLKRILWHTYRVCPALEAFLAAHYTKKRTR